LGNNVAGAAGSSYRCIIFCDKLWCMQSAHQSSR